MNVVLTIAISSAVGVLASVVTSWLSRRYFRDELGESDLVQRYLILFSELGEDTARIFNDALQASAEIRSFMDQEIAKGTPEEKIRSLAADRLRAPAIDLRKRAADLKVHYVLLPAVIIGALQEFEEAVWTTYTNPSFSGLALGSLIDAHERLLRTVRSSTRTLISRKSNASAMIDELPKAGYLPSYIRNALSEPAAQSTKTQQEG